MQWANGLEAVAGPARWPRQSHKGRLAAGPPECRVGRDRPGSVSLSVEASSSPVGGVRGGNTWLQGGLPGAANRGAPPSGGCQTGRCAQITAQTGSGGLSID